MVKVARVIFFAYLLFNFKSLTAQNNLKQLVTYSAKDKPIIDVLEDLSARIGIRFSYSSDIFPQNRKLSLKVVDEPFDEIIPKVLGEDYSFEKINDYLVIYKPYRPSSSPKVNDQVAIKEPPKVAKALSKNESAGDVGAKDLDKGKQTEIAIEKELEPKISIYDTLSITIQDTVMVTIYDTIKIQNRVPTKVPAREVKRKKQTNWNFDFKGASVFPFYNKSEFTSSEGEIFSNYEKFRTFVPELGLGVKVNYLKKRFVLSSGFNYYSHSEKVSFLNTKQEIIKNVDTLSTFFEEVAGQLEPIHIIDTSTMQLEMITEHTYINKESYLEIPILFGLNQDLRKFNIQLQGGVNAVFAFNSRVIIPIKKEDEYELVDTSVNRFYFNYMLTMDVSYKLLKNAHILLSPSFSGSVLGYNSVNQPFPFSRSLLAVGVGVRFFL